MAMVSKEYKVESFGPDTKLINGNCLRFTCIPLSKFAFMFLHPDVEELELMSCTWSLFTLPKLLRGLKLEKIRKVVLAGTAPTSDSMLDEIFEAFPNLRELHYDRPASELDGAFVMVGRSLQERGGGLEALSFRNDSLMPFMDTLGSLQPLASLKTLDIYLEFLTGFLTIPHGDYDEYMDSAFAAPEDFDYDLEWGHDSWSFLDLLPTSLEELSVDVDEPKMQVYYHKYERYGAKLEELLLSDRFDRLVSVRAPGISAVVNKIRDMRTGWTYQGNCLATRDPRPRAPETASSADAMPRVVDVSEEPMATHGEYA
ncbi:hypothetical protein ANO14919_130420 [Xylariales sp. No.14919]|nr:hypothetical protein ANO14919_130420 [Xylariales sp. No.14919]